MKRKDLTGQRFGKLVAIEDAGSYGTAKRIWFCQCDCGNTTEVRSDCLLSGSIISCGCMSQPPPHTTIHGHCSRKTGVSVEYQTWINMRQRCLNPNHPQFPHYGGRGITICERWQNFQNFFADMGKRPTTKSIDRIDNDAGYSPENCRWATVTEQQYNRRGYHRLDRFTTDELVNELTKRNYFKYIA